MADLVVSMHSPVIHTCIAVAVQLRYVAWVRVSAGAAGGMVPNLGDRPPTVRSRAGGREEREENGKGWQRNMGKEPGMS